MNEWYQRWRSAGGRLGAGIPGGEPPHVALLLFSQRFAYPLSSDLSLSFW